jgi:cytoskeletal protein RodZ
VSLISEALRKARQEDAKKDPKVRGVVPSTLLGRRSRSGPALMIALAVVLAAAIGAAAAAWFLLGGRGAATAARSQAGTPSAPAAAPAPSPTPARANEADKPITQRAANASAPVSPLPEERAAAPRPTGQLTTPAPEQPPPSAAAQGSLQEPAADGTRERVYVLDANLGHVKFHLDYIVYRPSAPFASINDQQVRIDSVIEGFEVTEISPDFVKLRGPRGTVVLRTH